MQLTKEDQLPRAQLLESKRLAKCLLAYVRHQREDATILFDIISITLVGSSPLAYAGPGSLLPLAILNWAILNRAILNRAFYLSLF